MTALRQERTLGDPYGCSLAYIFPPNYFAPPRLRACNFERQFGLESNSYLRSALALRRVAGFVSMFFEHCNMAEFPSGFPTATTVTSFANIETQRQPERRTVER